MITETKHWEIESVIPRRDDDGALRTLTVSWRCIGSGRLKVITFDRRDLAYIQEGGE